MKLISWNVNGIRAVLNKGFFDFVKSENPDVLCLQETKIDGGVQVQMPDGYHMYWNYAEKKVILVFNIFKIKPIM
jgi:exodeoxyribonuclease-3